MEQLRKLNRALLSYFCQSISPWFALKGKHPGVPNPQSMQPPQYITQLWKTCTSVRGWDTYGLIHSCFQHHQHFTKSVCPVCPTGSVVTLVTSEESIFHSPTWPKLPARLWKSSNALLLQVLLKNKKNAFLTVWVHFSLPADSDTVSRFIRRIRWASRVEGRREKEGRNERKKDVGKGWRDEK